MKEEYEHEEKKGCQNLRDFKQGLKENRLFKEVCFDEILDMKSETRNQPGYFSHFAKE